MDLNSTVGTVELYLRSKSIFTENDLKSIRDCFGLIKDHIVLLARDEKAPTFDERVIWNCLGALNDAVLRRELSKDTSAFLSAYAQLLYNWNENVFKNGVIRDFCMYIDKLITANITMTESFKVITAAADKLKLFQNWVPPAHSMSKAYLDSLFKETEKTKTPE